MSFFQKFRSFYKHFDRKKIVFTLIAILFTIGLLGWLVYSQWDFLVTHQWKLKFKFLLLAFGLYTAILILTVFTWIKIIESFGRKVSFADHFRSFCVSALGKRLPGTIWYVAWRTQMYENSIPSKVVVFASGIEMMVTIISAMIVSLIFSISSIMKYSFSIYFIVFLLLLIAAFLYPKTMKWLLKKFRIEEIQFNYLKLFTWVGLYVVIWILVGLLLFVFGNFLIEIPFSESGYFIGASALTGLLSRILLFLPTNFGFTEISLSLLLSAVLPSSVTVLIAIVNRIVVISFELIWALLSLFVNRINTRL